jgi:hypothetical protein
MKTVLTKFLAFSSIALLMMASCKKDGAVVKSNGGKPGTLSSSATILVLEKSRTTDTTKVISFTFTKPDYGFNAAITNTLQIDVPGDNWVHPASLTLGTKVYSQSYSTVDFNSLLLKLGLPTLVASKVQVRIQHSVGADVAPVYSNVLSLTVTPYPLTASIYIAGAYEGWSVPSANLDSLLSATSNGVYTGIIAFKPGSGNQDFKILPTTINYTGNYGLASTVQITPKDSVIVTQASSQTNITAPILATVDPNVSITSNFLTLDLNKNTLTMVPTLWSVVGDASPGGWPNTSGPQSDTDMKFNNGTQTWSVVVNLTAGGGIKFRKNHDWGTAYGSVTTAGVLDQANNNNITIATAGTYLVTIDLNYLTYKLVKQ